MKKFPLFLIPVLLLIPKVVLAEIKEGESTVNTTVTTNVNTYNKSSNNESSTHTYIELEVNGEKRVLDTDKSGTHSLSIEKDGGKNSTTVKIDNDVNNSSQEEYQEDDSDLGSLLNGDGEIKETLETGKTKIEEQNIMQKVLDQISKFFDNLFNFF